PVMDLGLPVAGAFVKGRAVVPQLLERFTPAHLLASTAGGDVAYSGLLQQVLQAKANSDEEQAQLAGRHPHTRFIDPDPGHCYQLSAD
ncbi:MAG: MBL fold metallo-hydrolase, partial [Synechococcus sp.]